MVGHMLEDSSDVPVKTYALDLFRPDKVSSHRQQTLSFFPTLRFRLPTLALLASLRASACS